MFFKKILVILNNINIKKIELINDNETIFKYHIYTSENYNSNDISMLNNHIQQLNDKIEKNLMIK